MLGPVNDAQGDNTGGWEWLAVDEVIEPHAVHSPARHLPPGCQKKPIKNPSNKKVLSMKIKRLVPCPCSPSRLKTSQVLVGLLALGASGCSVFHSPVPSSELKGTIAGQQFKLSNPKDTVITNLVIEVNTNGMAKMSLGYLASSNNSNVIGTATAGQAETINAMGNALVNAVNAGAQVAGTVAGKAAVAAVKP